MDKILNRLHALVLKLLGFKSVIWITSCVFLWYGKIAGAEWVLLSGAVGGMNVWQKKVIRE